MNGSPVMNGSSVGCEFYVTFLHAVMFGFYVYLQVLFTCPVIRFQLPFISACLLVRGLTYLKQPSVVKEMSRSHLLFKACGTLSPEEKLFIYSCINYAGTYQVEINHLSISWSQIMLVKRILEIAESLEMMIIEL